MLGNPGSLHLCGNQLKQTTFKNILSGKAQPSMAPVQPDGISPYHTTKTSQEESKDKAQCDKELKASLWIQNAPDQNLIEVHGMCLKNSHP